MQIVVNGTRESIPEGSSVADLVRLHGLAESPCAVEVNRELVTRSLHGDRRLRDGDVVEIVTLVGGG
ncbi:MAG: sulfur carrier protein ThiS [Planctomycetota bacterium]|nr:sulfur carrier protein ThiS [Planctomycetota bacterium]